MASRVVVEGSKLCEDGGGFETERWDVRVNNGWMPLTQLVKAGTVGGVTAELVDEEDPHGVTRQRWGGQPPQVYYRRRTNVTAPIGTHLRRHVWRPIIDRSKTVRDYLLAGDLFPTWRRFVAEFELCGDGRVVSVRDLAAKRSRREDSPGPKEPLSKDENRQNAANIVAMLAAAGPVARAASPAAPVARAGSTAPPAARAGSTAPPAALATSPTLPAARPASPEAPEGKGTLLDQTEPAAQTEAPIAGPAARRRAPVKQGEAVRASESTGKRRVG